MKEENWRKRRRDLVSFWLSHSAGEIVVALMATDKLATLLHT